MGDAPWRRACFFCMCCAACAEDARRSAIERREAADFIVAWRGALVFPDRRELLCYKATSGWVNDGGVCNEVQLMRQMGGRDAEEMDTEVLVEDEQVPRFARAVPSIFLKDALGRGRAHDGIGSVLGSTALKLRTSAVFARFGFERCR